jgi:hypothetical protein
MEEIIHFEGDNWWGDHSDMDAKIIELVKEALKTMSVLSVTVLGSDLQDGRQSKSLSIDVDGMYGKLIVTKHY